jgi:hypothetical protein
MGLRRAAADRDLVLRPKEQVRRPRAIARPSGRERQSVRLDRRQLTLGWTMTVALWPRTSSFVSEVCSGTEARATVIAKAALAATHTP